MAAPARVLTTALTKINTANAQGELYLTDAVAQAIDAGVEVVACRANENETIGVNCMRDLARAERVLQTRRVQTLQDNGVHVRDPMRCDVRGNVHFGRDCEIDINVILEGDVKFGDRCRIGANSIVRDSCFGDDCIIEPNCIVTNAVAADACRIGPYARIRPNVELGNHVRIGNFVEIKNSRVAAQTKINHLSYVGDSDIGARVNIGAGVITCNYDGARKHRTCIGDDVFVGSNSQLIAPVTIASGATIGAGSTINKDVAADTLAVTRAPQKTIADWSRPNKSNDNKDRHNKNRDDKNYNNKSPDNKNCDNKNCDNTKRAMHKKS